MCLDRANGKLLWQKDVVYDEPEATHPTNYFCSASPATDGERVVVSHGSAGMFCYDFEGKELWKKDLGKLEHIWGNASSPIIYKDLAILWCGPGERQFILAVNKKTGDKVWEHKEPGGNDGLKKGAPWLGTWSTPIIVQVDGKDQMILTVPKAAQGLRPGHRQGTLVVCRHGQPGVHLAAARSLTLGDGARQHGGGHVRFSRPRPGCAAWRLRRHHQGPRLAPGQEPAPVHRLGVVVGEHVYILEENGTPHCFELKTGKELWQVKDRPGVGAWGSMVHAAGRLYVTDRDGTTFVFAAGPKYEVLATNRLGEHTDASIAVAGGQLFIRTHKHLWCIGK